MTRVVASIGIALTLVASGCGSSAAPIQADLNDWAKENMVDSLSVAIIAPDGSLTSYVASQTGNAPRSDALYQVGSLTKTMVAALALVMAEDGVVSLDAPIDRWLPSFPRADEITLTQLLSHTAGVRDGSDDGGDLGDLAAFLEPASSDELLAIAAGQVGSSPLPAPHRYANSGYWVAASVLESAGGQALEDLMTSTLLTPLGLEDTFLAWAETAPRPLEVGIVAGPAGEGFAVGTEPLPGIMTRAWAAGGVVSTAADMARFYDAVFGGLIEPMSQERLIATANGDLYGLGIERRMWAGGLSGWGHNGGIPGYTASAAVSDSGWTVVVMANRFAVSGQQLEPDVEELVGIVLAAVS